MIADRAGDGGFADRARAARLAAPTGWKEQRETVTTTDGRTATGTHTIQVRTHDVPITAFAVPTSARPIAGSPSL